MSVWDKGQGIRREMRLKDVDKWWQFGEQKAGAERKHWANREREARGVEAVLRLTSSQAEELSGISKSVPSAEPRRDNPVPDLHRVEITQRGFIK